MTSSQYVDDVKHRHVIRVYDDVGTWLKCTSRLAISKNRKDAISRRARDARRGNSSHTYVTQLFGRRFLRAFIKQRKAAEWKPFRKRDLAMLRPLFLKAAGRSMALTNQPCDRLARKRSENVSRSPMSSTKLSSHSSRNAKLRPNWKTKLSSFRRCSKGSRRRITSSSYEKRGELFIRSHNETLPVVAMALCHDENSATNCEGPGFTGTYPGAVKQSVSTALK